MPELPEESEISESSDAGAAFELQLRLDGGSQPLNTRTLQWMPGLKRSNSFLSKSKAGGAKSRFQNAAAVLPEDMESYCFGSDIGGPPEDLPHEACGICFSDSKSLPSPAKRFCGNSECKSAFCTACFGQYAAGKVMDALHFVPPISCPSCKRRVRTTVWSDCVDASVRARYQANASSLMTIRCPECDQVTSLLENVTARAQESESLGHEPSRELREAWAAFSLGKASAEEIVLALLRGHAPCSSRPREGSRACERVFKAASLVEDLERRVSLQLGALLAHPKIQTPCCKRKMCFKCKVDGWHAGFSCEEFQQRRVHRDSSVQHCPKCSVPTQRTEGCRQVQCVCGHIWEWKKVANPATGVPLVLSCLVAPVDGGLPACVQMLRSFLRHGANIEARAQGCTVVHYAAGASYRNSNSNDSSRLEALLKLREEEGTEIDFQAIDDDGDSPLVVAVEENNVDAVRFLERQGSELAPRVFEKLTNETKLPHRRYICEALRPLLERHLTQHETDTTTLIWCLHLGFAAQALNFLQHNIPLDEELSPAVVQAFLWGQWLASGGSTTDSTDQQRDLLHAVQAAVGDGERWEELRLKAACKMMWEALESTDFPQYRVDVDALKIAIDAGANVEMPNEDGFSILSEAVFREDVDAVKILVGAGAKLDHPVVHRLGGLVLPETVSSIAEALSDSVFSHELQVEMPLWLAVQLGLADRIQDALAFRTSTRCCGIFRGRERTEEVDSTVAIAFLKRALLGGSQHVVSEEDLSNSLDALEWEKMKQDAATALLLLEVRAAFNFERDPDINILRTLLVDFGANANSTAAELEPELLEIALSHGGDEDEHRTPLMLLAVNIFCSSAASRTITELLLKHGADIERVDEDGDTALFIALLWHNPPMVEALVSSGASLSDGVIDRLQSWVHPSSLCAVGSHMAARFSSGHAGPTDVIPDWFQVQFGLPDAEQVMEKGLRSDAQQENSPPSEQEEQFAMALVLGGFLEERVRTSLWSVAESLLGEERWLQLRSEAAGQLLCREAKGNGLDWDLDLRFVEYLLGLSANPNLLVDLDLDDEEDSFAADLELEDENSVLSFITQ